jgi:predicted dehydrogenase
MEQMKHFVEVVRGEAQSSCSLEDGVRVMKLISAINESQNTGKLIAL